MRKYIIAAGILALGVMVFGAPAAQAAVDPNSPKILLHVRTVTTKNVCTTAAPSLCSAVVTSGDTGAPSTFSFVYLMVAKGNVNNTVAGLQCGIDYQNGLAGDQGDGSGIDIYSWNLCATLEFISPITVGNLWPAPGGGNLITWDSVNRCQSGELAAAGYFYMGAYTADALKVTPRPVDGFAKVADCDSQEFPPLVAGALGTAAFSAGAATAGCNPCFVDCAPVPVENATWGGIKNLISR